MGLWALTEQLREELARLSRDLPRVFHAGRFRIHGLNPEKFQSRDEGYYGKGFYVSDSAEYVRSWYGPVVTALDVSPDARILWAAVDWRAAPEELRKAVEEQVRRLLQQRGKESELFAQLDLLRENQIEWVHMVDMYAEDAGFDIVVYNSDEIVVKNPAVLQVAWTGAERNSEP